VCLIRTGSVAQQSSSENSSGRREDRCSFNIEEANAAADNATRGSTALRTDVRIFVTGVVDEATPSTREKTMK
jgi:hypothetical protein